MISDERERLDAKGCRRFFLSPADWWKLGDEMEDPAPKSENASRLILEGLGFLLPPSKDAFVNMQWRGCPVLWRAEIDNL